MARDQKNRPATRPGTGTPQTGGSGAGDVQAFLNQVRSTPTVRKPGEVGRLIFAMDATASREPTWDQAMHTQAEMFQETKALGGLQVQLAYYRGFGEFEASDWYADADALLKRMTGVRCLGGRTQIEKVLKHARKEAKAKRIDAVVFVGDCMEEDVDQLCHLAGELGLLKVPVFAFHEGRDQSARRAFEQIARLSGGACCSLDAGAAKQLRELLAAVAVFAAGGRKALADYSEKRGGMTKLLTHQMK
jgi:hypothetical protein